MIELLTRHLYKERVNGRIIPVGGMEFNPVDERDFQFKDLGGWFDYKPKHEVHVVNTASVKDQAPFNNCVFQSYAVTREVDEKVPLSVRSLVRYAKMEGMIRGDGFSNLRSAQKAGLDFGIAEESLCPPILGTWQAYSSGFNSREIELNAISHRAKSFFRVTSHNDYFKALDEGRAIHTGFTWRTKYNLMGGLRAPWVLPWGSGVSVGGHAVALKGYDMKKGLFHFQNSFGSDWGDGGDFYVPFEKFDGIEGYVAVDMDGETVAKLIEKHTGHDVKSTEYPEVYRIEAGKKRPYLNEASFFMHGGNFNPPSFTIVSGSLLNQVPMGEPMP